ncbi:MAG: exo-alpha-sialidase [Actinomycetota bacterium]
MTSTTELLVGTKKGLFVLRGDPASGDAFEIATRAFPGDVVEFAMRDPRTGRTFASVTSGFYGPRVFFTDGDPAGEWTQADGPTMPESTDSTIERIWSIVPGEAPGQLWAGVAHAALFESRDDGQTWTLNAPLWSERIAGDWQPGAGGLALHSICPWPGDPQRLAVGVSAAGVWITEDGGQSWRTGYTGLVPLYVPEDEREDTNALCVHNMHRSPTRPDRLFLQFHGSVYRSDDEGGTWNDIAAGLPAGFGFPLVIDPADPDSAFVIPLNADFDRVTPEGKVRVYETRDAGASWTARGDGLPHHDAYLTVYRQAFGSAGAGGDLQLYFGATSGDVFGSADAGASWFAAGERLAPVTSVRVATGSATP